VRRPDDELGRQIDGLRDRVGRSPPKESRSERVQRVIEATTLDPQLDR
jgi:hypothetical protein